MEYSYYRRVADAPNASMLDAFERIVVYLAKIEGKVRSPSLNPTLLRNDQFDAGATIRAAFAETKRRGIQQLFLTILQSYKMVPKDRKIIERASKTFAKRMVVRIKPEKAFDAYLDALTEWRLFLATAKSVIATGAKHDEEGGTVIKVGSFTLVNTGGFPDMQAAVKVVEKAEQLLRRKQLGRVCYGPIQVTNTVGRSTRVLAFYRPAMDELYVRANLKGKVGPGLDSVLHELGHRLHYKFLHSKDAEIRAIYRQIATKERDLTNDRAKWPAVGTEWKGPKYMYEVTGFRGDAQGQLKVLLKNLDRPGTASVDLRVMLRETEVSSFVSDYAASTYQENFAEMIQAYCQDTLPADQVEMLEAIL